MRILLIGEFSNVHATLAETIRRAGHEVLLVSDGDDWKGYRRDVSIQRKYKGKWGTMHLLAQWALQLPKLKGFDIVHFINPKFTDMNPSVDKWIFRWLARHNGHVSVGLYGDDYIVLRQLDNGFLHYSELQAFGKRINVEAQKQRIHAWTHDCKDLCQEIIGRAETLIACLYEYHYLYRSMKDKDIDSRLHYIGLPIRPQHQSPEPVGDKVKVLFAIQTKRISTKGYDVMLPLFQRLAANHPDKIELIVTENVPFHQYKAILGSCDVLVDQFYSYTPAMNALEAMSRGIVVISGGEEDYYRFIGENKLRPIINLRPLQDEENYRILEETLLNRGRLYEMKQESIDFINKYHDAENIANEYLNLWKSLL